MGTLFAIFLSLLLLLSQKIGEIVSATVASVGNAVSKSVDYVTSTAHNLVSSEPTESTATTEHDLKTRTHEKSQTYSSQGQQNLADKQRLPHEQEHTMTEVSCGGVVALW